MVDVCDVIKVLLKFKHIHTDNNVFRLHYKYTGILLLAFSFLVTSKQFFGDPIDCNTGFQEKYIIDTYCWIYSTFTVKQHHREEGLGKSHIFPGIGPSQAHMTHGNNEEIISHKYYQWVCIVLVAQALCFYIPRYLWKVWEAGRLKMLVKDFDSPIVSPSWNTGYKEYLTKYIMGNSDIHNVYLIRYTVCEVLNFINVTAQICLMDWFLGGQFFGFGVAIASFSFTTDTSQSNPMSQVFPKLAKCTYQTFGPSGSPQDHDALCVLPLNVLNEKMYVVLWLWFYFLAGLSLLAIIYRVCILFSPFMRSYIIMAQVRFLNKKKAKMIVTNISFGDWFILYQLGKNCNAEIFSELIDELAYKLMGKKNSAQAFGFRV